MRIAANCLICALIVAFAQPNATLGGYNNNLELRTRGGRYNGSTDSTSYVPPEGYKPTPDASVLQHLQVVWGSVKKGLYAGTISIAGAVMVMQREGESSRPVDWFQGFRVLLARTTGSKPDWSAGHSRDDTVWTEVVVRPDGTFDVMFDRHEIVRIVGSSVPYQVGISLAEPDANDPFTLTWDVAHPAVQRSVATVDIEGPAALDPDLQTINAATGWGRDNYDPTALIRAVNHLRPMGKRRAIDALKSYLEVATDISFGDSPVDPHNIDTGDRDGVFWIIRLLFEPANAGERLPIPALFAVAYFEDEDLDSELWPHCPIALNSGVPFFLHIGGGGTGLPEDPKSHLEWARDHGVLRDAPLRPADDPLAAADELIASPKFKRLVNPYVGPNPEQLRRQAYRMVADLLPDIPVELKEYDPIPEDEWQLLRTEVVRRGVHWDEARQEFAISDDPPAASEGNP